MRRLAFAVLALGLLPGCAMLKPRWASVVALEVDRAQAAVIAEDARAVLTDQFEPRATLLALMPSGNEEVDMALRGALREAGFAIAEPEQAFSEAAELRGVTFHLDELAAGELRFSVRVTPDFAVHRIYRVTDAGLERGPVTMQNARRSGRGVEAVAPPIEAPAPARDQRAAVKLSETWRVQLSAGVHVDELRARRDALITAGQTAHLVQLGRWVALRAGPFPSFTAAQAAKGALTDAYPDAYIVPPGRPHEAMAGVQHVE